jgi:hypothetical protein
MIQRFAWDNGWTERAWPKDRSAEERASREREKRAAAAKDPELFRL